MSNSLKRERAERLYEGITGIDDELIEKADEVPSRKKKGTKKIVRLIAASAAVCALLLLGGYELLYAHQPSVGAAGEAQEAADAAEAGDLSPLTAAAGDAAEYDSVETALIEAGASPVILSSYLEENYTLASCTSEEINGGHLVTCLYEKDSELIEVVYRAGPDTVLPRSGEPDASYETDEGFFEVYLDGDVRTVYTEKGNVSCRLSGIGDEQTMKAILDSTTFR